LEVVEYLPLISLTSEWKDYKAEDFAIELLTTYFFPTTDDLIKEGKEKDGG
jgi:hypothetical protein